MNIHSQLTNNFTKYNSNDRLNNLDRGSAYILQNYEEFITIPTLAQSSPRVTITDIFCSEAQARDAVLELERQGLHSHKMAIVAENYEKFGNPMNWQDLAVAGGLATVLIGIGIDKNDALELVNAVESGNFLVVAIVSDRIPSQAQHILKDIGRWVVAVH